MAIARRIKWYLDAHELDYHLVPHSRTSTSLGSAQAAHVPEDVVAKSVLLEDELGYLIAILPASHRIDLRAVERRLGRKLELATEAELGTLFFDCETGAVPPLGRAYGIPTLVDDSLLHARDVYFEAGDHKDLVHMDGASFLGLLRGSRHGSFSRHL